MSLKKIVLGKLNAIEEDLKIISEIILEIRAEKTLIEYLLEEEEDKEKS